jgi:hypothetical protein
MGKVRSVELTHEVSETASRAIKQIDPNAKLLAPSPNIASSFSSFVEEFLSQSGASSVDGVAWHGYRCQKRLPSGATYLQGTSCDNNALDCAGAPLETQIQQIQMSMQNSSAGNMPIYDTEGGWGQKQYLPNRDDQVAYVSRWVDHPSQRRRGNCLLVWLGRRSFRPHGLGIDLPCKHESDHSGRLGLRDNLSLAARLHHERTMLG